MSFQKTGLIQVVTKKHYTRRLGINYNTTTNKMTEQTEEKKG